MAGLALSRTWFLLLLLCFQSQFRSLLASSCSNCDLDCEAIPCDSNCITCVQETYSGAGGKTCSCVSGCSTIRDPTCPSGFEKIRELSDNCAWPGSRARCESSCTNTRGTCTQCKDGYGGDPCTASPTPFPTPTPTKFPTNFPTENPTQFPTPRPTPSPTPRPTRPPTKAPTQSPTPFPTYACGALAQQCGGTGWTGATCCQTGLKCVAFNSVYDWCVEDNDPTPNPVAPTPAPSLISSNETDGGNDDDNNGGNDDDSTGGNDDDNTGGNDDDNSGGNDDNSGGNDESNMLIFGGVGAVGGLSLLAIGLYTRRRSQSKSKLRNFLDANSFTKVGEIVVYEDAEEDPDELNSQVEHYMEDDAENQSLPEEVDSSNPMFGDDLNEDKKSDI